MFGKLSLEEIEQLLTHQLVGRLGCHAEGVTYVVPISYVYDGTFIYCHTYEGMKLNMMRKNPSVCFEVDNTKNLADWQSVVAWGKFEELPEGNDRTEALKKLEARALPLLSSETMHLDAQWPFISADIDRIEGIVFRIRLVEKTGRFEKTANKYFFAS